MEYSTVQGSFDKIVTSLPRSSAYNGPTGLMSSVVPTNSSAGATSMDDSISSGVVYRTPVPTDTRRKDRGESALIVTRNSTVEVRQELHKYQAHLESLEAELGQLKEKVDKKRNAASVQRITSLDLELCRNRKSYELHLEKVRTFEDKLAQLQADTVETKEKLETSEQKTEMKMAELENRVRKESNQMMDDKINELMEEIVRSRKRMSEDLELATEALRSEVDGLEAATMHEPPASLDEPDVNASTQPNEKVCSNCNMCIIF